MHMIWLDVCRGFGIVAVYYGHVAGRFGAFGIDEAVTQWRILHAFHVPLFFLLSGYLQKGRVENPLAFLRRKGRRLVLPIWFFNALFVAVSIVIVKILDHPLDLAWYGKALASSFSTGAIRPCGMTWFLYCLMSVFVLHTLLGRLTTHPAGALLLAVASGALGHGLTLPEIQASPTATWIRIWYLDEAFVAYAFFLSGLLLRRWQDARSWQPSNRTNVAIVLAAAAVFFVTLDWNQGPFAPGLPGVALAQRSHGGAIFFLTALAGSLACVHAARLVGPSRPLEWIGIQSLPFFTLNAAFYGWINPPLVRSWEGWFGLPQTHGGVFLWVAVVTAASLLLTAPVVWLLARVAPTLSGAGQTLHERS